MLANVTRAAVAFSALFAIWAGAASLLRAEVTAEQKDKLTALRGQLAEAGKFYRAGKFQDAAEAVVRCKADAAKLMEGATDADFKSSLGRLQQDVQSLRKLLSFKGVTFSDDPKPEPKPTVPDPKPEPKPDPKPEPKPTPTKPVTPKPTTPKPEPKPTPTKPTPAVGGVSFLRDVAPMLAGKCGRCHINKSDGGFNLGSYASLMRGSKDGRVISDKDGKGSRIVEVIESGDMPRGGGKVTDSELNALIKWIDAGAVYDGADPKGPIQTDKPVAVTTPKPTPTKPTPTKPEPKPTTPVATGVSFAADVAHVLATNCVGCHGGAQPRAQFSLENFQALMKGGMGGSPITAGDGANSLLIKKLKGTGGGARMPMDAAPLPDATIAKIEKWIDEGAKYDGPTPTIALDTLSKMISASKMSPEQLSSQRVDLAIKNWKLASPDSEPNKVETENFLLVGAVNEAVLKDVGERAETIFKRVAQQFKVPSTDPLVKGRITLFCCGKRYDYTEFAEMVEKRQELPATMRGHWKYTITDAYGALQLPRGDEDGLDLLLAEAIAGVYLESLGGGQPKWFTFGIARAVAYRIDNKSSLASQWDAGVAEAFEAGTKIEAVVASKDLATAEVQSLAYSYCKHLLSENRFTALLSRLQKKLPFDRSFREVYKDPDAVVQAWMTKAWKKK